MSVTFSPGCGSNTYYNIPAPITGWDTCYLSSVLIDMSCTMTIDKVPFSCQCDSSGSCSAPSNGGTQTLLCNGQPIAGFPHTGDVNATVSASCTYKKAGSTSTTGSVTITSAGSNSVATNSVTATNAGISLTKSNMLIAASLVLCAVIGSF
ncbi:hypothetical protein BC943DRAFT_381874 [Umbelopsis sp. AD052]|nr:hypothetical protein BC943DRAFT_381874 [Umbelopsis sp. AD052]